MILESKYKLICLINLSEINKPQINGNLKKLFYRK